MASPNELSDSAELASFVTAVHHVYVISCEQLNSSNRLET